MPAISSQKSLLENVVIVRSGGRLVECTIARGSKMSQLTLVKDAGHNNNTDRATEVISAGIQRQFNANGFAIVVNSILPKILVA